MKTKKKRKRRNEKRQNSCSRLCSSESNYYHCFTNSTYISHRWITFSFFQNSTHVRRHLLPLYIAKTILMKLLLQRYIACIPFRLESLMINFSPSPELYIHRFIEMIYNCCIKGIVNSFRKFCFFRLFIYLFIYLN